MSLDFNKFSLRLSLSHEHQPTLDKLTPLDLKNSLLAPKLV